MSVNALEKALWELGRNPDQVAKFNQEPDGFCQNYRLEEEEHKMLCELDVKSMAEQRVSTLLLMMAWLAVKGPGSIPDYMQRMNS